jgi:hypothetical protein
MKPFKIEPVWALALGFFIAPVVCMVNAVIVATMLGDTRISPTDHLLTIGFLALCMTGPMGFQSMRLLQIWEKGDTGKARGLAIGCGLFAAIFWLWTRNELMYTQRWSGLNTTALLGALALPFVWSTLFPLLAIFARVPRSRK